MRRRKYSCDLGPRVRLQVEIQEEDDGRLAGPATIMLRGAVAVAVAAPSNAVAQLTVNGGHLRRLAQMFGAASEHYKTLLARDN